MSSNKDNSELTLTKKYLTYPLNVLNIFGLWSLEGNSKFMYPVYSFIFLIGTQYMYAVFQIIYMIIAWGEIEKIAEASFLLLTQATLCIKIVMFFKRKGEIKDVIEYMDDDIFIPKKEWQWKFIDRSVIAQKFEFFLFIFMSTFTIILWAIFPLIDAAPEERVLPFKAWYPLPMETTPYYEFLYSYQIIAIWFSALINISIDRLSTAMTANGCAQVEILMDNLVNIEKNSVEELMDESRTKLRRIINIVEKTPLALQTGIDPDHENIEEFAKINEEKIDMLIGKKLNDCVRHHQNIVRFVKNVELNFHWGVLAQFAASVGIICITGLQITLINPASLKFASKILYFMAMLAQIFFICRIGNDISAISTDITDAAYASAWVERKRPYKTTLLIFLERLKQPIITRAGNFFPLSLQTFVGLLRSSYSYFAVLQQLNSD